MLWCKTTGGLHFTKHLRSKLIPPHQCNQQKNNVSKRVLLQGLFISRKSRRIRRSTKIIIRDETGVIVKKEKLDI